MYAASVYVRFLFSRIIKQGRKFSADELKTRQLTMKDSMGMTLVMVAAQGGMVPIIRAVLRRVTEAKARYPLACATAVDRVAA